MYDFKYKHILLLDSKTNKYKKNFKIKIQQKDTYKHKPLIINHLK
jgi:hypothetical protein